MLEQLKERTLAVADRHIQELTEAGETPRKLQEVRSARQVIEAAVRSTRCGEQVLFLDPSDGSVAGVYLEPGEESVSFYPSALDWLELNDVATAEGVEATYKNLFDFPEWEVR